jgi:hypothetical protein
MEEAFGAADIGAEAGGGAGVVSASAQFSALKAAKMCSFVPKDESGLFSTEEKTHMRIPRREKCIYACKGRDICKRGSDFCREGKGDHAHWRWREGRDFARREILRGVKGDDQVSQADHLRH